MHGIAGDKDDDPSHPIPSLESLDAHAIKKSGGSDLVIVIASPLRADERSQTRLLNKIEIYLDYVQSSEYRELVGTPNPEITRVLVRIHRASDREVFELLERCGPWALSRQASLIVQPLDPDIE